MAMSGTCVAEGLCRLDYTPKSGSLNRYEPESVATLKMTSMTDAAPANHSNEALRRAALRRYDVLEEAPEGDLDNITTLAARLFEVPMAFISFVDEDVIRFKSQHGLEIRESPREPGLCASAILQDDVWHIEDALHDTRAAENSLVTGQLGVRFYAGAPFQSADGHNLGVVGVMDRSPRALSEEEQATLQGLAQVAAHELELQLATRRAAECETAAGELASAVLSDMREALSTIGMVLDSLRTAHLSGKASQRLALGLVEVRRLRALLEEVTAYTSMQDTPLHPVDLDELIPEVLQPFWKAPESQRRQVAYSPPPADAVVAGDRDRLQQLVRHLLVNAWEAVSPGERIDVSLSVDPVRAQICLEVNNPGKPVPPELIPKLTEPFVTTKPRHAGLGLAIVKRIVEAHHGELSLNSDASLGTRVQIWLPISST